MLAQFFISSIINHFHSSPTIFRHFKWAGQLLPICTAWTVLGVLLIFLPCALQTTIMKPPSYHLLPPCGAAGHPESPSACNGVAFHWLLTLLHMHARTHTYIFKKWLKDILCLLSKLYSLSQTTKKATLKEVILVFFMQTSSCTHSLTHKLSHYISLFPMKSQFYWALDPFKWDLTYVRN